MRILFINGSPEREGNTARLAKTLLGDRNYETYQLPEHRIFPYGSVLPEDEFDALVEKMKAAVLIVIGSPVYWHNICGAVRTMLDRFYGVVNEGELSGRKLAFLFQGEAPERWMLDAGEYTISRFAMLYGMEYVGMASSTKQAKALSDVI